LFCKQKKLLRKFFGGGNLKKKLCLLDGGRAQRVESLSYFHEELKFIFAQFILIKSFFVEEEYRAEDDDVG
jgi:hypothetical protein